MADAVLAFWRASGPDKWFTKDATFDAAIREKFLATYESAARGELAAFVAARAGALAGVIVLDHFTRHNLSGISRT